MFYIMLTDVIMHYYTNTFNANYSKRLLDNFSIIVILRVEMKKTFQSIFADTFEKSTRKDSSNNNRAKM